MENKIFEIELALKIFPKPLFDLITSYSSKSCGSCNLRNDIYNLMAIKRMDFGNALSNIINCTIVWAETNEGHSFWRIIHDCLLRTCSFVVGTDNKIIEQQIILFCEKAKEEMNNFKQNKKEWKKYFQTSVYIAIKPYNEPQKLLLEI